MADPGGHDGRAPPGCPSSFNFIQFLGKFRKIIYWHLYLREILDPPLPSHI